MVEVTGCRTGKTISFPAVVAGYGNGRYLVSMLGEGTSWVRNVRDQRAPILRCYLQRAPGARAHIPAGRRAPVGRFERIAARYLAFRVRAAGRGPWQ